MGLRPSSKSNPTTVSRFLDTGYDNVKKVADNIEDIGNIASSIDIINQEAITQVEVIGQGYVDQAEAAKIASEQAASDSQGYSVTAINAKNESIVQVGIATDKANEALQSANESASQSSIATTQANLATGSANAAATSENNALSSSNLAENWATNGEDILVNGSEYSAKHYSIKASASATQASLDAQTISDQLDSTYLKAESDLRYFQVSNNLSEVDPTQGRSNLGLGTAATRNVGESAGNVLEVGAFGIGSTTTLFTGNISTLTNSGLYWYGTAALNKPTASDGHLLNISRLQGISANISMVKNVPEIYIQNTNLSTEWFKSYSSYNILGTVSQSGGVPTGAIIESGSNVNGRYVKYADGTLICTHSLTQAAAGNTSSGALFISLLPTWIFPAAFISPPYIHGAPDRIVTPASGVNPVSFARLTGNAVTNTNSSGMFIWYSNSSSTIESSSSLLAIGRWY